MINILYEPLPERVSADGRAYGILTDFREWLRFADMHADPALTDAEKCILSAEWLTDPPAVISEALIRALFAFFRAEPLAPDPPPQEEDDEPPEPPHPPYFDWKTDACFLLGDFRHYYGIDLLTARLHWWEFRSLFAALPDGSMCSKRIAIRAADLSTVKDPAARTRLAKQQRQIALPFDYDDEMIGAMLWNT